jgi:hypothetical protein
MPTDFEKENDVLKKRISLYENDATYRGYYALNKIVNQQVDRLNKFNLESEISQNAKEDKVYDRTKAIWEGLRGMISDLNILKAELKITGNEERDGKKVPFIETVAEPRY